MLVVLVGPYVGDLLSPSPVGASDTEFVGELEVGDFGPKEGDVVTGVYTVGVCVGENDSEGLVGPMEGDDVVVVGV